MRPFPITDASPNLQAFCHMIAWSEVGPKLLATSDDGYNVIVGGQLFNNGYVDHPRVLVWLPRLRVNSTAAGRYQLLARYFDVYKVMLKLPDFSPLSQTLIAIQQMRERRALPFIESGDFTRAVAAVSNIWASLPGAGYGQSEHRLSDLEDIYRGIGGKVMT